MYIEEGYTIKHDFWRYILGWFLIFMGWQLVGMIPLMVAIISKVEHLADLPTDITEMSDLLGSNTFLFLMLLAFAIAMINDFFNRKIAPWARDRFLDHLQKKNRLETHKVFVRVMGWRIHCTYSDRCVPFPRRL